ncbi:MAG TPA: hypothetical protein VM101_15190 [Flavitalea sp.]|nr:hypothetical protein [Flavitalea sp.]
MKGNCIFIAFIVILSSIATAQTSTQRLYIKGGNEAYENFMKEVFRYPSFVQGIVQYKNGQRFKSNLNYNKVLGTIEFIDEKGDTLAIADETSISFISVGDDIYRFVPGCLQELIKTDKAVLYKNEMVRIADKLKTGGYGIPNSAGTIEAIERPTAKINYKQMEINESLLISKVSSYYIKNDKNEILPASKKNVLALYSKKEDAIKSFIKEHSIDFTKEDDLATLTRFISTI